MCWYFYLILSTHFYLILSLPCMLATSLFSLLKTPKITWLGSDIPRRARWERAYKFGLEPDPRVIELLDKYPGIADVAENLWHNQTL